MDNPLGTVPVRRLIIQFSIPAIANTLVNAVYNITDQIFIGHTVGMLGNAATNIAFPITTLLSACALMIGMGSSTNFGLSLGAKKKDDALRYVGNGISLMIILGLIFAALALIFLKPLLILFGATEQILPLASTYLGITAFGMPFLLFATAFSSIIRADGSPTFAMITLSAGAILNIPLNALFMLVLGWGIAGSALATVIAQIVSFILTIVYLRKFKAGRPTKDDLVPRLPYIKGIVTLGAAGFLNHFIMMLVQITMNNTLAHYGALSQYGSELPLAVVGVISKVNFIVLAFVIGIAQGAQPIISFNYGAKNYARVREAYLKAAMGIVGASVLFFLCFQLFPRQIVGIFGNGSETYLIFATQYMRIFMVMMFISGIQPLTSNFFVATGKAKQGIFLALTRQGLFLLPLLLILPLLFGIEGVIFAGPIADSLAVIVSILFMTREMKAMKRLNAKNPMEV
ncbi:MATE family efflux transporter [Desulfosporosinus hippei]|uniref:Multidrug export protein MepA n=1 Tax=Desulfosporosinus hippei DSM 8344 TaxID=1121419 RepID=A0A1G8CUH9_9FIRM|nr:putative efflux protein, MATE family [Desulfosporosinus hippei DSM 8344]